MGGEGAPAPGALRLQVKTLAPATHAVELPRGAGLGALRGALEPLTGVPPARQRLLFLGRALRGDGGLEAAGVRDGSVLHMVETPEGAGPGAGGAPGAADGVGGGAAGALPGMPQLQINADLHISSDSLGGGEGGVLPLERFGAYISHVQSGLDMLPQEGQAGQPLTGWDNLTAPGPARQRRYPNLGGESLNDLRHYEVQCDGCDQVPIRGRRYKSLSHPNYDLCEACWGRYEEAGHLPASTSGNGIPGFGRGPFACLTLPLPPFQPINMAAHQNPRALESLWGDLETVCPAGASGLDPTINDGVGGCPDLERLALRGVGHLATGAMREATRAVARAQAHAEALSCAGNDGPLGQEGKQSMQSNSLHLAACLHSAATLLAESARVAQAVNLFPVQPGPPLPPCPLLLAQDGYLHQDSWHSRLRPSTGGVMGNIQAMLSQALSQTGAGPPGPANPQAQEAPPAAPTEQTAGATGTQGPAAQEPADAADAAGLPLAEAAHGTDGAGGSEGGKPEPKERNEQDRDAREGDTVSRAEARSRPEGPLLPARKSKAKAASKEAPLGNAGSSAPASTPAAGASSSGAPALPARPSVKAKARPSASAKASKRGVPARRKPQGGAPVQEITPVGGAVASPATPMDPLASLLGGAGGRGAPLMGMVSQMAQSPAFASMAGQMMGQMAGGSGSDSGGDGVPDLGGMMEQMMPMVSQMFGGPPPGGAAQGAPRPAPARGGGGVGQGDPWAALSAEERAAWQSALQADRERIRGVDIPSDLSHVYIAGDPAFIDSLGGAST